MDRPRARFVESEQQPEQRRLSTTGRSDKRDELAGTDGQGDVLQYPRTVGTIAEMQTRNGNLALQSPRVRLAHIAFRSRRQNRLESLVVGTTTRKLNDARHSSWTAAVNVPKAE